MRTGGGDIARAFALMGSNTFGLKAHTASSTLKYLDISEHVQEMYGISVSKAAISTITDKVIETVKAWQQRPLDSHYPFVWLDAIHYKVRIHGHYENRAVYTVLGITLEG